MFISYRMSGDWISTVLHEGTPDGGITWDWVEENMIAAQTMTSDEPVRQQAILQLDGQSQRWIDSTEKGLLDGLSLVDGTYLDIIGGDSIIQDDGSVIGWKECEIPDDCLEETLTFQARLYRNHSIMYQDGTTYRQSTERGEMTTFELTLTQNTDLTRLKGSGSGSNYTAVAELTAGHIDLRGTITVTCPDTWIQVWNTWENPDHIDMIEDWFLYFNDEVISENGLQGVGLSGENRLVFEVMFDAVNDLTGITLVPVYQNRQPHIEEAIILNIELKNAKRLPQGNPALWESLCLSLYRDTYSRLYSRISGNAVSVSCTSPKTQQKQHAEPDLWYNISIFFANIDGGLHRQAMK